ncbi:MAG: hypothetical protein EHM42_03040 [Planctomycetaceae bacterium]|nr:MAG: hypothetical protein EHM42_03040 [Planctomycetaceae bacterium]
MDRYFAVVARGVEFLAAKELVAMGAADVREVVGGVHFSGPPEILYRALLTLQTASRVLKPLREFAATTPEMVYSQVRRVVWEAYLNPQRTLAVSATAEKPPPGPGGRSSRPPQSYSRGGPRGGGRGGDRFDRDRRSNEPPPPPLGGTTWLMNTMFAAQKIKDAICDRLKNEQGARPNVDKEQPDISIQAHFAGGRCTLSLDATGPGSLHERGYRGEHGAGGAAPMKETLAAAILQLTGWNGLVPLYDPLCGSGTLVIEAARIAMRMPAGGGRAFFACEKWPDFDGTVWAQVTTELRSKQLRKPPAPIFGSDASETQLLAAKDNAYRAKVDRGIEFILRNVEDAVPPTDEPGIVVTNPPYGIRLGDEERLAGFYTKLGEIFRTRFPGWIVYMLIGNLDLVQHLGMEADDTHRLMNGPISCRLMKFDLTNAPRTPVEPKPVELPADSGDTASGDAESDETDLDDDEDV